MEKSDKVRIMSHVSPGRETSVVLYLVLHFSEVWKNEIVRQSGYFGTFLRHESLDILSLVTLVCVK